MEKFRNTKILVIFLVFITLFFAAEKEISQKPVLLLIHPRPYQIEAFDYFLDNGIIDIPNLKIRAVYYSKADYDVERIKSFIKKNKYGFIETVEISGLLSPDNLFKENELTSKFKELFKNSDGAFFLGGADLPPKIYKHKTSLLTNISTTYRHYFEISFLFHLLGSSQNRSHRPFLQENSEYVINGFCLGMQTINVAAGGSMYQDIPSEIYGIQYVEDVLNQENDKQHRNYYRHFGLEPGLTWGNLHRIKFTGDFFRKNLDINGDSTPVVYSSHHQAVKDIAQDYQMAALSMDGKVIEAIVHKKYPYVLGVQFHPEKLAIYKKEIDDYQIEPKGKIYNLNSLMKKQGGYQFHLKFWDYFSRIIR